MARMHTKRHVARFLTYGAGTWLAFLSLRNPLYLAPLLGGLFLYLLVPYSSFVRLGKYPLLSGAIVVIPILLVVIDTAKMAGYLKGLAKEMRHVNRPA